MLLKKYILSLLFAGIIYSGFAQYRYGITGGVNVSSLVGKDFSSTDFPKLGITAGFFYEYEFKPHFSLLFEPMFEQKGADYTYSPKTSVNVDVDNKLNYITIPLMIKNNFGRNINYYLTAGLSLSYLINYNSEVHAYLSGYEIPYDAYFPYTYKKLDAGASLGFGIMWKEIFLDFRYIHGLRRIYDAEKDAPDIRNHVISVKLAFSLYRKKYLPCYKKL